MSAPLDALGLPAPKGWPLERVISLMAGTAILVTLSLARLHHRRWRLMTAFIGTNLVAQGTVGWCPASGALYKLGVRTAAERQRGTGCAAPPRDGGRR